MKVLKGKDLLLESIRLEELERTNTVKQIVVEVLLADLRDLQKQLDPKKFSDTKVTIL
jgi:hypothetical protein